MKKKLYVKVSTPLRGVFAFCFFQIGMMIPLFNMYILDTASDGLIQSLFEEEIEVKEK